ncbi:MAG: phosphoribosylglycinamide formyltransferase [Candidatus Kapabacteria bacterium]|nr:phosphoribosylglycinamide formyltransferase [Candidatus Kapabacteria bacterium]
MTLNLGFLASHGGSNMQAIIESCKQGMLTAIPRAVISNNSKSLALEKAKNQGIATFHVSGKTHLGDGAVDRAIVDIFKNNNVDTVILAGYMKIVSKIILDEFKGRVLNIHPALLPDFGGEGMFGLKVHEAVLKAGEKESGCTVHLVDEIYDNGRILGQSRVPVFPVDDVDSLSARVLVQEHILYSKILKEICEGRIVL